MNVVKYISESHRTRRMGGVFLIQNLLNYTSFFPVWCPVVKKRKYIKTIELIIKLYDSRDLCFFFFLHSLIKAQSCFLNLHETKSSTICHRV